jgi:hypothetical protein
MVTERLYRYKMPRIVEMRDSLSKMRNGRMNRRRFQMECA